jgi:hypothetical protein
MAASAQYGSRPMMGALNMSRKYGNWRLSLVKAVALTTSLLTATLAYGGALEQVGRLQGLDLDAGTVLFNGMPYSINKDMLKIVIQGTVIEPERLDADSSYDVRVIVRETESTPPTTRSVEPTPALRNITTIEIIGPKAFVDNFFNH